MGPELLSATVDVVMTRSPQTIAPNTLVSTALAMLNRPEKLITALFVVENGKPVGILHIHDLLRIGVA
jgi:arabinose-5-phosphate isomerase